jgi:hypothetical protein
MNDLNLINQDMGPLKKIAILTPDQRKEIDTVLTKFLSGEPITDQDRKENPEMWTNAEKYFDFGRARVGFKE